MPTQDSIINNALRLLGEPPSAGANDTSKWVVRITNAFSDVRRNMFEDHDWNFATSIEQLAASANSEEGWTYTFAKPSGCFRIIRVSDTTSGASNKSYGSIDYEERGGYILTEYETSYCAFVDSAKATQYGSWPQKVADLLGAMLADEVYPVTDESDSTRDRIEKQLKRRKSDAKQFDARSNPPPRRDPGSWHQSRSRGISNARRQ